MKSQSIDQLVAWMSCEGVNDDDGDDGCYCGGSEERTGARMRRMQSWEREQQEPRDTRELVSWDLRVRLNLPGDRCCCLLVLLILLLAAVAAAGVVTCSIVAGGERIEGDDDAVLTGCAWMHS